MSKITAYTAAASLATTDIIPCVVDPGGTPATKKATVAVLQTAVLTAGTFVSLGTGTFASTGHVRFAYTAGAATRMSMRNLADTADYTLIETSTSNMYIGTDSSFTVAKQISSITINPYATMGLGVTGATHLYLPGGGIIEAWKPIIGSSLGSSPHGVHGVGAQAMADGNVTVAADVYKYNTIKTTGAITADRNLVLPAATDAAAYTKMINNTCSGAFGVIVKDSGAGTAVTVANGKSAMVLMDSRGCTRLTADV